ncbi:MAG TPA: hypothetical protein VEB22_15545 [Phycisphaerales bacterium]|nr:hypothetical protein [Phycisphaerales bacterium]
MPLGYTLHAVERWVQRVAVPGGFRLAVAQSVAVPARRLRRKGGVGGRGRYRVTASAVLVVRGRTVVTVYELELEDLAAVLVHELMGIWT